MTSPVIILVRPQLGENIGKAARAMLNFGLTELRLVAPRDGWPNPAAGPAASGADSVLDEARLFDDVAAAIADLGHVYAATVRPRGMAKPVVTPEEAVREMRAAGGRSGILFGAERSGLDNDEVALADSILTIPVNPDFSSLNLAQAVIIAAYEWHKAGADMPPRRETRDGPPASKADYQGLYAQLEGALEARGYFRSAARKPVQIRSLRTLLQNARLTAQEIRTLRGVVKTLTRPPKP
ncbi:MAG: RNA methyltransferase [Rhodothalassiaceae bacterium]